jgi:hypothetical protein
MVRVAEVEPELSSVPVELSHCARLEDPVASAQLMLTLSPTEYMPNRLSPACSTGDSNDLSEHFSKLTSSCGSGDL